MASGLGMQGDQITKEDVRRVEHEESAGHKAGNIPAGSDAAAMQSMMDKQNQNKGEVIEERKGNLPLPEQPPTKSDFNSADASTVNVGSGGVSDTFSKGNDALREPATGDSAVRTDGNAFMVNTKAQGVGREAMEGGLPNDAVARDAKDKAGLVDTTNKDYGYPQKNDPTS
ncbi:hypothetical protein KC343_g16539 [Hortaea werneckii]|uniref:Uncharacterized protein n=1 Tax=Hortaea werneckii TaxID=91943 RepID=A0A3M7CHU7_HORWE|nr:hypothetical protein KC352_g23875 [Hortaea werneckii]KAI7554044.1 hypothetical protein KC317_g13345 [Hortaea werneckii]KAI7598069.1 hypothetical protein KC343_g16539 [Hortaea werneckii]KAI7605080.1 hypothetical protein KC346_g11180 [Hortaea werneckii]KAI7643142.1 hypothetical protein KC319_g12769 [Hortaea werneckii]